MLLIKGWVGPGGQPLSRCLHAWLEKENQEEKGQILFFQVRKEIIGSEHPGRILSVVAGNSRR